MLELSDRAIEIAKTGGYTILFVGNEPAEISQARAYIAGVKADVIKSCPCGNYNQPTRECHCDHKTVDNWTRRITNHTQDLIVWCDDLSADQVIKALEFKLEPKTMGFLTAMINKSDLTLKQANHILDLADTIKELANENEIKVNHIAEAYQYIKI